MNAKKHSNSDRSPAVSCTSDLAIRVKDGRAIISGIACSADEVQQAEAAVYSMSGVSTVYNLVKTNPG